MSIRDDRQLQFAKLFVTEHYRGILHLCPRFGKIRTTIHILNTLPDNAKIMIAYPDNKIKDSWLSDFEIMGYKNNNIVFTTHLSMKKFIAEKFDLIIIDEIHLLSEAQKLACLYLFTNNKRVLGLTGTLSKETRKELLISLNLHVLADYPIETAIKEGVLPDYEIHIVSVGLDRYTPRQYGKYKRTEKAQFDYLTRVIDSIEARGGNTMFMRLARMRVVQNSLAKVRKTQKLLELHKDERILVFCGVTSVADSLGIPSYHSKSSEKKIFEEFAQGTGNHLAVVKIGNTGVTYKPLSRVIINYFDSNSENLTQKINRCMSMEYDNPEKKAMIYIVTTDESVEKKWLNKALEFFNREKIKYVS